MSVSSIDDRSQSGFIASGQHEPSTPAQEERGSSISLNPLEGESPEWTASGHALARDFIHDDAKEDAPDRPNRYTGPASTWYSWTEPERLLHSSLLQQRAEDLSLHLYCAHNLKVRLRHLDEAIKQPPWAGKERWFDPKVKSEDATVQGQSRFYPPKVWTAWPMPSDLVPRQGERPGLRRDEDMEAWTVKRRERFRPSRCLEDLIMATIMKMARQRSEERESTPSNDEQDGDGRFRSSGQVYSAVSDEKQDGGGQSAEGVQSAEGGQVSQAKDEAKPTALSDLPLQTVVMADDRQAYELLRPTARHILSKVDQLLQGLHHTRHTYASSSVNPVSSDAETQPNSPSLSRSPSRSQSRSRHWSRSVLSNTRKAHRNSDSDSPTSMTAPSITRRRRRNLSPASQARSLLNRQARLGLRDWSDVVGIASLTGWDYGVIYDASDRCARLFGEAIRLRTLEESAALEPTDSTIDSTHPSAQLPINEQDSDETEAVVSGRSTKRRKRKAEPEPASDEEMLGGVHVDGWMQPIKTRRGWRGRDQEERKKRTGSQARTRGKAKRKGPSDNGEDGSDWGSP